jgi:Glycosyltransferase family 87
LALGAGVAVLLLVAACVAVAWPVRSALAPAHTGHPVADERWAWIFLACEAAAFVAFLAGLAWLRAGVARLGPVLVLAVAIQLTPLFAPLLLSSDAWTYWDQGRIAVVHHANPYTAAPADFPGDPALPYVGTAWRDSTSVYGPAFQLPAEPIALAAGSSAATAAWIYKSLAAAALLTAVGLTARLARRKAFASAFVGWNPLLAIHFAGGGHNDAWMAALVLAALAFAATGRRQLAGAAWALAILIKWVAVLLLPLRALEARARGRKVEHLGFAVAAGAVMAAATLHYGLHWVGAFGPLARNASRGTMFSLPHRLSTLGLPHSVAVGLCAVLFAAAYGWLAWQAWRGRARLGLTMALFLLATPYLIVWYVVWAAPLAAVEDDRTAQVLTLGLSAYLLRQTIPL